MAHLTYKELTVRKRPHFQPLDATLFVTFRLADLIPKSSVRYYNSKLQWLREQLRRAQRTVADDPDPGGVEWVDRIEPALSQIMRSIKGRSARECNLLLGRSGSFWEHESFDRVIRAGKFEKTVRYVLNNPVKIRLVSRWQDYQWNYLRKELWERFE